MLVTLNHGQKVEPFQRRGDGRVEGASSSSGSSESAPAIAVLAFDTGVGSVSARPAGDHFGYMFDGAGLQVDNPYDVLGAVGTAMSAGDLPGPSGLAAVLTYFGQFVDHDITANTDRDPANLPKFAIGQTSLTRNSRGDVLKQLGNLRRGTLRLDSLYGDGMPIDTKLRDGAHMRVGGATDGSAFDLPRFGPLVTAGVLSPTDFPSTDDMHSDFGRPVPAKIAFIADSRNDENLVVAQLHLAFLRFHNAVADMVPGSDDERFAKARQFTCWTYQWLLLHHYLPLICDPAILASSIADGAPRYRAFAARHGGAPGDHAPVPLEFSVAGFRFGHSMIRPGYAFNDHFPGEGAGPGASMRDLCELTGRGGLGGADVLPHIWIIDWARLVTLAPDTRQAKPLDPALAPALADMVNEHAPHLRSLAQRNLRRSYVLNIPTAQAVLAQLVREGHPLDALTDEQLRASPGGAELFAQGLGDQVPLWFYVLAEAAVQGEGKRLGQLGSLLVAETLVGLLVVDPESVWHAGTGERDWIPADAGIDMHRSDGFEAFFRFAGVM